MKHELTEKDRLVLLNILPVEGSLIMIRILRELREGLSFTEEELAKLNLRQLDDGRTEWNELPIKGLDIGPKAASLIYETLEKMDQDGKLTINHLDLCDRFEYTGE